MLFDQFNNWVCSYLRKAWRRSRLLEHLANLKVLFLCCIDLLCMTSFKWAVVDIYDELTGFRECGVPFADVTSEPTQWHALVVAISGLP